MQVSPDALARRCDASAELLEVARPHLDWISAAFEAVRHVACLTDRDGVVLYATGTDDTLVRGLGRPGQVWSEGIVGTNGVGTALVTGEPVTIEGPEHFLEAFHGCTCTGAPVRGPAGQVIGAVNVSTAATVVLGAAERLRLVAHAAYAAEQELRYRDSLRHASGALEAERRLAEETARRLVALDALRESEARFRGAFDHAAIGMAITHPDGRWARVNRALCEILGYTEAELIGARFESLTYPDDIAPNAELLRRALAGEVDRYRLEKRFIHREGHLVWVALSAVLVRDGAGVPLYFVAQMQDVTERKRAEAALGAMEARYARHVENAPGVVYQFVYRPDGSKGFTVVSDGARRLFGVEPAAILRDPAALFGLIHPDDQPGFYASGAASTAALAPWRWEGRVVLPTGEEKWVQVASQPVLQPDGSILCDGLLMDATAPRQAAARLAESEERYRSLFDHHPDAVVSLDLDGRVQSANPASRNVSGYEPGELVGQPYAMLLAPDQLDPVLAHCRAALGGVAQSYETTILHQSGRQVAIAVTAIPIVVGGAVVGVYGIVRDLTAQHSLEAQLRQAQKMEAVGRLAGGIAHDFNNLLTAILANAELALGQLPGGPVREDVETIRQTAERAAALTRQLLAFSRKQVVQPQLVDLNALVTATERLLRRTLAADVALHLELSSAHTCTRADPSQLEQVILNLAVNAGDAMPAGGTLTLRTRHVVVDEAFALRHRGLRPGDYVTLAVEDTGVGIPPELQMRIFEPFFTTKPVDKGTGLGLATVYGIVKQYGGYTAVESTPDRGTTFLVYLPRLEGVPVVDAPRAAAALPTGTETVLVVEDELAVRRSVRRILSQHGYTVLEAAHGADALRMAEAATHRLDLVVTDLVMPEMGGRELLAELAARGCTPRILVTSGYDERTVLRGEPLPAGAGFLEKPFTLEGLLRAVRAALDAH